MAQSWRRYCTRHLSANWKKAFPGPLMMSLFWKASATYSPFTFRKAMEQIQKLNHLALVWLAQIGPQSTWTRHQFDPNIKSDVNKTNFVESFNATLEIDRCRPILSLFEGIRRNTMVRLATRRQVCETWKRDDICPNIITRVKKLCHDCRTCRPFFSKEGEWEVLDGKSTLPVSLNKHTYLCGAWQISGIPCKHGMRAILAVGLDPHKFVDAWYSVQMYKTSYSYGISSISDHESWPEINTPNIDPPIFRRAAARPSRNRKRAENEERKGKRGKTVKCSKCQAFRHNAKTCKGGVTVKEAKQQSSMPSSLSQPPLKQSAKEKWQNKIASTQP